MGGRTQDLMLEFHEFRPAVRQGSRLLPRRIDAGKPPLSARERTFRDPLHGRLLCAVSGRLSDRSNQAQADPGGIGSAFPQRGAYGVSWSTSLTEPWSISI